MFIMEQQKSQWSNLKKSIVVPLIVLLIMFVSVVDASIDRIKARQLEGQWAVLDSQEKLVGENDPDGFEMLYPADWRLVAYSNGNSKNLVEKRIAIEESLSLFGAKTYVSIWWKRVNDSWTMYDARDWYIKDLGFGLNQSALQHTHDSFSETNIGAGEYLALERVFKLSGSEKRKVVVFVVGNEAFAIEFHGQNYKETEEIFEQMLSSFEDYEK